MIVRVDVEFKQQDKDEQESLTAWALESAFEKCVEDFNYFHQAHAHFCTVKVKDIKKVE